MTHSPPTYPVDGRPLTADQCRALFAAMPLQDRQIKVLERIEGDTIIDIGCFSGAFVCEASTRFPGKTVIGVDYSEDNIRIARLLYPDLGERFRRMSAYGLDMPSESADCITLHGAPGRGRSRGQGGKPRPKARWRAHHQCAEPVLYP